MFFVFWGLMVAGVGKFFKPLIAKVVG